MFIHFKRRVEWSYIAPANSKKEEVFENKKRIMNILDKRKLP